VRGDIGSMREWRVHIALETRARTREDLEGPAHGGLRARVPPRASIAFVRATRNAGSAPRCGRRVKSDRKGGSKNGPRERRRRVGSSGGHLRRAIFLSERILLSVPTCPYCGSSELEVQKSWTLRFYNVTSCR